MAREKDVLFRAWVATLPIRYSAAFASAFGGFAVVVGYPVVGGLWEAIAASSENIWVALLIGFFVWLAVFVCVLAAGGVAGFLFGLVVRRVLIKRKLTDISQALLPILVIYISSGGLVGAVYSCSIGLFSSGAPQDVVGISELAGRAIGGGVLLAVLFLIIGLIDTIWARRIFLQMHRSIES